ncbi:MAG TPA: M28 family peptidase [Gemmatimonadaceae bacterium]|nr:M28 family peptidase [Gemmatimonadaceae bacterium]
MSHFTHGASSLVRAVAVLSVIGSAVGAQGTATAPPPAKAQAAAGPALNRYGNPEKHTPQPTTAAITVADLMTRLYIFSDDSMMGRQVGREGNMKGTNYIARELKRLGVQPAGDSGTYFQRLPFVQRKFTDKSTMTVKGVPITFAVDFVPMVNGRAPKPFTNVQVIYGGVAGDTVNSITPEQAAGKFVILLPAPGAATAGGGGGRGGGGTGGAGRGLGGRGGSATPPPSARYPDAVAVATIDLDALTLGERKELNNPQAQQVGGRGAGGRGGAVAAAGTVAGQVIVTKNGSFAVLRDGSVVSGSLPAGMTPATVQAQLDSIARSDSITAAGAAAARGGRAGGVAAGPPGGGRAGRGGGAPGGRGGAGGGAGRGAGGFGGGGATDTVAIPETIRLTRAAAERLMGRPVGTFAPGILGWTVSAKLDYVEQMTDYARNVVGIIRGSDPKLRGQYVAIGAHNDHLGFTRTPVDHDLDKAYRQADLNLQMASGDLRNADPADLAKIKFDVDSIHRVRPMRLDSIYNGADDDGSGSMAVLEIAEAIAHMPVKPKRSILFVWHTGEESGLNGSTYFTANPTVPLDSIVAQINIDMIGRGRAEDVIHGGPDYVGVVGSKRLSADLGNAVTLVNQRQPKPFAIDYGYDDPTLGTNVNGVVRWPGYNNIYGRSDHYNYAKKCIPIAFFFSGLHADYHKVSDEAQYIDFPHYTAIANYIHDLVLDVAEMATRPSLDAPCVRS